MHTHDAPWAVITGASRGLGSAFAEACAARGMRLVLVALPGTGLGDRCEELRGRHGVEVLDFEADLADKAERDRFIAATLAEAGAVSLLVNNAGVGRNGRVDEIDLEFQERMVDLNVSATLSLSRAFLPALEADAAARGERSRIIIVSSLAAFQPMPLFGVYAATKTFLLQFGLALRHEAAERGVGVTVLCPGGILTGDEVRAKIRAQGLAGRLSAHEPSFVAEAALRGSELGRAIVIPGWFNRLVRFLGSFLPADATAKAVHSRWKASLVGGSRAERKRAVLASFLGRLAARLSGLPAPRRPAEAPGRPRSRTAA